ncbi:PGF-CTERM sorting domain-containing protein [Halopiger djelfimassiliensis]|uniref:PGF-CTERM sorting domain-containing protein n=1 Tax=Halopiger djelfimassiliensis TaxID=1293047 RepID=UPI00067763B5|nr:PGF-CTERM sorting domain-containing protein [Halopiger djelfimassiliensis]
MSGSRRPKTRTRLLSAAVLAVALAGIVAVSGLVGPAMVDRTEPADPVSTASSESGVNAFGAVTAPQPTATASTTALQPETEEVYVERVPEEGDPYYEAAADDGSWISYVNPRDQYRTPYLGEGSGKVCITLVDEDGNPVPGETVPNTTVSVPTDDNLDWHDETDPVSVEYPVTENYERPLDADQFGTAPDISQGDGYLDSHCVEWHGLPEDETVEYGEVRIEGEHADQIDLVGYVQQANDAWDASVDPIEDAESYEETGGSWTYEPDGTHGQVVAVLEVDAESVGSLDDGTDPNAEGGTDPQSNGGTDDERGGAAEDGDSMPGFGVLVAVVALLSLAGIRRRG